MKLRSFFLFILVFLILISSCKKQETFTRITENNQQEFEELLKTNLNEKQRYSIINQMATNYLAKENYHELILFLTKLTEENPDDLYNSYWLLMTAYAYLSLNSDVVAEYYFERVLNQEQDLLVKGNSIHFLCLQNLIQISKNPTHRIRYFNELIERFSDKINITELYLRLAVEYQNDSQWNLAIKSYENFLAQPDAATIQIPGEPDAYKNARHLIDFNKSSKDWTFESLPALESAIRKAIKNYDWRSLDKYKAKVNFFSMSWKQDETDANSQEEFSMRSFMRGNRIRISETLDEDSNPTEAYLRTWGWSNYVPVWYLYFRKVNFPVDPDIHGNWEWAGIYMGNKL